MEIVRHIAEALLVGLGSGVVVFGGGAMLSVDAEGVIAATWLVAVGSALSYAAWG